MDEKKEIEELADVIENRLIDANRWIGSMNKGEGHWIAEGLIPAYRKADEVRKETAMEILEYIFDPDCYGDLSDVSEFDGWAFTAVQKERVFKRFGVEVDE